jgi:hypothetical protein
VLAGVPVDEGLGDVDLRRNEVSKMVGLGGSRGGEEESGEKRGVRREDERGMEEGREGEVEAKWRPNTSLCPSAKQKLSARQLIPGIGR